MIAESKSRPSFRHPEVAAKRPSKDTARAPRPHPSRAVARPPQDDGKQANDIVLAARFFSRPSFAHHAKPRMAPQIRSSSDEVRQWMAGFITIGAAVGWAKARSAVPTVLRNICSVPYRVGIGKRRCPPYKKIKTGSGTPIGRCSVTSALARGTAPTLTLPRLRGRVREGAARLSAFHRGSRQRDSRPKGSTPGHASCDLAGRPVLCCRPNRGAKTSRSYAGVTRARLSQSRDAPPRPVVVPDCLMPEAAREKQ